MGARHVRPGALAVLLATVAASASAQAPDSTAAPVSAEASPTGASSAEASPAAALPADSLAPALVGPVEPPPGRPVTPVPAVTPALGAVGLLDRVPGAFSYGLGAPGRWGGVSLGGLDPSAPALLLDGRPLDDLFDGRPRYDLLPAEALAPLRLADVRLGRPLAVEGSVRPFRLARPVTELRYLAGQEGVQMASATHAQTRLPPRFLRGGSPDSRLTATAHVASRNAAGLLAGVHLRHSHALGRLLLTRPGLAVEVGDLYTDRAEGARRGVLAETLGALFDPGVASPVGAGAVRRTFRNELWAAARFRLLGAEPVTLGAAWTSQRQRHTTASAADTLGLAAQRVGGRLDAPFQIGRHRLLLRLDAAWEPAPDVTAGGASLLPGVGSRVQAHAALLDSLVLGPLRLAVEAGAHRVGDDTFGSAAARAEAGGFFAGVRTGPAIPGRLAWAGVASRGLLASPVGVTEGRTDAAEAGWGGRLGAVRLGLRGAIRRTIDERLLVAQGDTAFQYVTALGSFAWAGVTADVGWRERVPRGLYIRANATVGGPVGRDVPADGDGFFAALHERQSDALPRFWGRARIGLRAEDVGEAVLDLDLAVVADAWTAFRGRVVEPVTGALALPDPGAPFGYRLPARGTFGVEATATFRDRASVFLLYENALAGLLYDGAVVVPGEPLPAGVLRFGVFWVLLD